VTGKNTQRSPDVVVIGGGVIGLSIAWRAAEAGLSVTLYEDSPGRGASWAAAGLLAPVTEVHHGEERVLRLGVESLKRYPDFIAALEGLTGMRAGYRGTGTLIAAPDADSYAALGELWRLQDRLGLDVRPLGRRAARELEPALTPRLRGAWLVGGDHAIDNRALAAALTEACRRRGVDLVDAAVSSVVVASDRVRGVTLRGGPGVDCGAVVIAAGCWSALIEGIPDDVRPPVRPVKGQLIYLRGAGRPAIIERAIRGVDVYLVPRGDGRIVVGATVEERGSDTTVTAEAVYTLLRHALELVPGLSELELVECVAGLRPGSPDNVPMIGATGIDGLLVATGHYRNGILLTPLTADAIAQLLTTGRAPDVIAPASPQRFQTVEALP
jgi:glycine oxidase